MGRRAPAANFAPVATPDFLTLKHHRDLEGRERRPWIRWAILTVIGTILGLLDVFGQPPSTSVVSANGVELEVYSPDRLRSGLFSMARFTIRSDREIRKATLVLDSGWLEGITLNTIEPSPVGEASQNGRHGTLAEVQWAVLETNGQISFVAKS